jgi:copper transport protein
MGRILALSVLAIVFSLSCVATPARAHAVLLATEPAADTVVDKAPPAIILSFSEPVRAVSFRVIDGTGGVIADERAARVADNRVELRLGGPLPEGGYIVTWRVMSTDSHPVGGSFRFAVGDLPVHWQTQEAAHLAAADTRFWSIGLGFARAVHFGSLLIAAGGIWFVRLIAADRPRLQQAQGGIARSAAITGTIAALAGVGLLGGLLLAARPSALLQLSTWQAGLSTPIGRMLAASALMLSVTAAVARRPWDAASLAALLAIVPLGLAGHVSVAEPRWLTEPSLILHLALASFWLGSLPPLLLALRLLPGPEAAELLLRFSRVGVAAVFLLVAAGTAMAAVQLRNLAALWQTSYGMVLAAKLVLVAGLILLALANKQRLTPALAADRPRAAARLSRNIWLEIVLIGAVLALTATLGFNTPPRALHAADGHEHREAKHHDHSPTIERKVVAAGVAATLVISPGRPGLNTLRFSLEGADGGRVDPRQVEAHIASARRGIEPVTRRLAADGDRFTLQTSDMALPGTWQIRIDVLVTDFDRATFKYEIDIR